MSHPIVQECERCGTDAPVGGLVGRGTDPEEWMCQICATALGNDPYTEGLRQALNVAMKLIVAELARLVALGEDTK